MRGSRNVDTSCSTHICTYTKHLISMIFFSLYNCRMVKQTSERTHLDDFSSSVGHGQWTSVQSRGGREEEQLAHLVHPTEIHTPQRFMCRN